MKEIATAPNGHVWIHEKHKDGTITITECSTVDLEKYKWPSDINEP
jgi:hypothetical protein